MDAGANGRADREGSGGQGRTRRSRDAKANFRDRVIDLLSDVQLWHDPERFAFATVPVDSHNENHEIGSNGFKDWLASRAYEATGSVPPAEAIEAVLRVARTQALRGPCHRTWRRFAEHGGRIYLDLGCPKWRAVEIAAIGWGVVDTVPVKFLSSRGMLALPEPEAGERIEVLREFVNVESDADFRLLVAVLAATMRPSGPFVILAVTGPAGSSKSTLAKIMVLLMIRKRRHRPERRAGSAICLSAPPIPGSSATRTCRASSSGSAMRCAG